MRMTSFEKMLVCIDYYCEEQNTLCNLVFYHLQDFHLELQTKLFILLFLFLYDVSYRPSFQMRLNFR